jgi:hypothetical protein
MSDYNQCILIALSIPLVCGCSDMNGVVTGRAVNGSYASIQTTGNASTSTGFDDQQNKRVNRVANVEGSRRQLTVNTAVWSALSEAERVKIKTKYEIDITDRDWYGIILDVQGINESTAGTNSGTTIGQAYGSAMYVDRAFQGSPTYSATNHVSAALLGAILGSSLDRPPEARFHFMYTIKDMVGNVIQQEQVSSQPFHQPTGICLSLPSLSPVSKGFCDDAIDTFRKNYLLPN